jgi:hypothetical protein
MPNANYKIAWGASIICNWWRRHRRSSLGGTNVHQRPALMWHADLFPLQHEVSQALKLMLQRPEQQAGAEEPKAKAHWEELSAERLDVIQQPAHLIKSLDERIGRYLEQRVGDCVDLFQRSNAFFEGHHGFRALYQYGNHGLSPRKQQVLTALHNIAIRRPNGTTAAEHFFTQPHACFLEQILERIPWPAQLARCRPRPVKTHTPLIWSLGSSRTR